MYVPTTHQLVADKWHGRCWLSPPASGSIEESAACERTVCQRHVCPLPPCIFLASHEVCLDKCHGSKAGHHGEHDVERKVWSFALLLRVEVTSGGLIASRRPPNPIIKNHKFLLGFSKYSLIYEMSKICPKHAYTCGTSEMLDMWQHCRKVYEIPCPPRGNIYRRQLPAWLLGSKQKSKIGTSESSTSCRTLLI